jgi:hypothetical protein
MAERSEEAQEAVVRLTAAAYTATIGTLLLLVGVGVGVIIGLFDIFIAGLLLGKGNIFTINTFGDGFGRLATRTLDWYNEQLAFIAYGIGEFEPTPDLLE